MNEYLSFKKFITPTMIQVIFWIGIAVIVLGSLAMMFGVGNAAYGGGGSFLVGLLYLIFGSLFWRVWCEIMLVVFRIHDEIHMLRTGKTEMGAPSAG